MKPTPELIDAWRKQAEHTTGFNADRMRIVAELAAQWGAEQSQDGKRYRWLRRHTGGERLTDDYLAEATHGISILHGYKEYNRAIANAVIAKLAAGVSVEPAATLAQHQDGRKRVEMPGYVYDCDASWGYKTTPLYTAAAIAAARVQALEEAAQIAATPFTGEQDDITMAAKDRIAAGIRALIGANHG